MNTLLSIVYGAVFGAVVGVILSAFVWLLLSFTTWTWMPVAWPLVRLVVGTFVMLGAFIGAMVDLAEKTS